MYSSYKQQRILCILSGCKEPKIAKLLWEEGMFASRRGIHKFLCKYKETVSRRRRPGSSCTAKIVVEIKAFVERQMQVDDETTATQLRTCPVNAHGI